METKEQHREEVIKGRIEEMERINKLQSVENPEELEEHREPLSIDTEIVKKILLSWGGGSDGFKLYFDKDKELIRGVYFMANWGWYEETELTDEEAQQVYDFYMCGECL